MARVLEQPIHAPVSRRDCMECMACAALPVWMSLHSYPIPKRGGIHHCCTRMNRELPLVMAFDVRWEERLNVKVIRKWGWMLCDDENEGSTHLVFVLGLRLYFPCPRPLYSFHGPLSSRGGKEGYCAMEWEKPFLLETLYVPHFPPCCLPRGAS